MPHTSTARRPSPALRMTDGRRGARIAGLGHYRPERVVTNSEIAAQCDTSDEWIRERSGIESRRFAAADETVADMAVMASTRALESAEIAGEEVDLVLVATSSHVNMPAAACEVTERIGAGCAPAADVGVGCAGFTYALSMGAEAIRGGSAKTVVVAAAEKMSDCLDLTDRNTSFLFGDGAGAVVLQGSDTSAIGPVAWGSDGSRRHLIEQSISWPALRNDPGAAWPHVRMDGAAVFRWAMTALAPIARQACELAGLTLDDLDAFVPHQANGRIIDALVRELRLPKHVRVARDVADTGNTSAASVPLALSRMVERGDLPSGGRALLFAFGAGLSFAGQVVAVP